jgi:hypothetical protein
VVGAAALDRLGRGLERALDAPGEARFVALVALAFGVLAASLSQLLFGGVPHIQDSAAQFIHAKVFAQGMLTAPSPEPRDFFLTPLMIDRAGRWYSQFPPGHTALLALGHLAGAPWLVNPLLGSLCVPAVYALAREIHGRGAARAAARLLMVCPIVVVM